jgi:ubiquinone biosynthesis protein COQ4
VEISGNSMSKAVRPRNPLRFGDAWRALQKLIADPDRTDQVFVIINALAGNSGERQFRRFATSPVGKRVLAEERDILAVVSDRDTLNALPDGSLGKAYAAFMTAEKISADGLVDASEKGGGKRNRDDVDRLRYGMRMRDSHDLWHVATGYNRDLLGEAMLLAFTFAQTRNPGIGVIVAMAFLKAGSIPSARRMILQAYRRGRRAQWLPGADWEHLLSRPLDEVRRELGLQDLPPVYVGLRSNEGRHALESSVP